MTPNEGSSYVDTSCLYGYIQMLLEKGAVCCDTTHSPYIYMNAITMKDEFIFSSDIYHLVASQAENNMLLLCLIDTIHRVYYCNKPGVFKGVKCLLQTVQPNPNMAVHVSVSHSDMWAYDRPWEPGSPADNPGYKTFLAEIVVVGLIREYKYNAWNREDLVKQLAVHKLLIKAGYLNALYCSFAVDDRFNMQPSQSFLAEGKDIHSILAMKPSSLQHMCVICVRQNMSSRKQLDYESLPLPPKLQTFVSLEQVAEELTEMVMNGYADSEAFKQEYDIYTQLAGND